LCLESAAPDSVHDLVKTIATLISIIFYIILIIIIVILITIAIVIIIIAVFDLSMARIDKQRVAIGSIVIVVGCENETYNTRALLQIPTNSKTIINFILSQFQFQLEVKRKIIRFLVIIIFSCCSWF
jgi:hypothetical protein